MSSITVFDGTGDMRDWAAKIAAKLTSKGYKNQLSNDNKPADDALRVAWDSQVDKAIGVIQMYLEPAVVEQFAQQTPQELLKALKQHYGPDANQELERLEGKLTGLTYDGSDPVAWVAKVWALVAKLASKNAAPSDRAVQNAVLKAVEQKPEYKIRVEMI